MPAVRYTIGMNRTYVMPELTIRPIRPNEYDDAAQLVARAFSQGDPHRYDRLLHHWRAHLPYQPHINQAEFRAGFLEGRLVALVRVEQHILHYGRAALRVAGIGDVCTDEAYRGRGYSAALMRDALAFIAEQGAHLALLYNRNHYYQQYGFTPIFPDYALEFKAEDASRLEETLSVRPAEIDDLPAMAELYDAHWSSRLSFRRSSALWRWRLAASDPPPLVVEEAGRVRGYWWRSWRHNQTEVVADTLAATRSLIAFAGRVQAREANRIVRWLVPPDDALVAHAQVLLPVQVSAMYRPDGGWMGRLIDMAALVRTLLPELRAQARVTHPDYASDNLVINVQPDVVEVGWRHRPEQIARLYHRDFLQIVFGSLRPSALTVRGVLSPAHSALLERLFPPRMAALAPWDWF